MRTNKLQSRPEQVNSGSIGEELRYPQMNVPSLDGGMNTIIDSNDLPDNQMVLVNNMVIRNGKLRRRFGESAITPVKPNSEPILGFYTLKRFDGTLVQLRISTTKIYRRASSSWVEITNAGGSAIINGINNLVSTDDRFFFSTNGDTVIQEINLDTDTYAELGNAPRYKYITIFDNRLVGFNLVDSTNVPIQVGWTGTFDYDEWDPLVNFEAGNAPLEESQSDYADVGTGIYGLGDKLLIVRERSIWYGQKTGVGQQPFLFYTRVPSLGCDIPSSIAKIPGGICFYDRRTRSVYAYTVEGEYPTPIGRQVEEDIFNGIDDPDDIISGFDSINLEFKLGVPQAGTDVTRCWTYSFRANNGQGAWWFEDREDVTAICALDFAEPSVLIGELVGTIGGLLGTIGDLSETDIAQPVTFYGLSNGDILQEDVNVDTGYDSSIISKNWTAPQNNDFFVNRVTFGYDVISPGSFVIAYSKDNGLTFTNYKTVTLSVTDIGKRLHISCVKSLRCFQYCWKITSSNGIFTLLDFKALSEPAGYSR